MNCIDLHTYQSISDMNYLILQDVLFCQVQLLQRIAKYQIPAESYIGETRKYYQTLLGNSTAGGKNILQLWDLPS